MFVKSYGSACYGISAITVTIEADVTPGIKFFLVGLPDSAVRESEQRISIALESIGLSLPGRKIVVNMAPADLRKEGAAYDLPIALAVLAASDQLSPDMLDKFICMGELALDGSLRPVKGALSIAAHAKESGFKGCLFPMESAVEASYIEGLDVYGFSHLVDVVDFLNGGSLNVTPVTPREKGFSLSQVSYVADFANVKGQYQAKRALEIAASSSLNVLLSGSPGVGKSYMAKCIPSILPPLTLEEAVETTKIYSVAGLLNSADGLIWERPFRAPHHSASVAAFTGGGPNAMPGEISLAHNGVLYLDELPEFQRVLLEVLRQPLEDKCVNLSRVKYKVSYPANFMLVASMNPCPCGYAGHPTKPCTCTPLKILQYKNKLSGPLLDRMDMRIVVSPVEVKDMFSTQAAESSAKIRERVLKAREIQERRFASLRKGGLPIFTNSQIPPALIAEFCPLTVEAERLLKASVQRLSLSARAHHRLLRLARSIADLSASPVIEAEHVAEAMQYR